MAAAIPAIPLPAPLLGMCGVSGNNNCWTRAAKVPCQFRSRSESPREGKFHGTNIPGSESSRQQMFHRWNFSSRERKYVGTKVPVTTNHYADWLLPLLTLVAWYRMVKVLALEVATILHGIFVFGIVNTHEKYC